MSTVINFRPTKRELRFLREICLEPEAANIIAGVGRKTIESLLRQGLIIVDAKQSLGWTHYAITPSGSALLERYAGDIASKPYRPDH